jgi:predicted patatin/cPLA2 family phospholipase
MTKNKKIKALVCSGGGNRIGFIAGVAEKLIVEKGNDYDIVVGISAGALSAPFLALNATDQFRDIILNITNSDIYAVSPFKFRKNKKGEWIVKPKKINILWNYITKKFSIGDSSNLLKTIKKNFPKPQFSALKKSGKKVIVGVTNLTKDDIEYKNICECSYNDACDWIWGSTCVPVFMSVLKKNGCIYVDGGVKDHIPIQQAIDLGADEIDIIVLKEENNNMIAYIHNVFGVAMNTLESMFSEIMENDIRIANLEAGDKRITLNFYYLPENPPFPSLIFNPKIMNEIYTLGKELELDTPERILIRKNSNITLPDKE